MHQNHNKEFKREKFYVIEKRIEGTSAMRTLLGKFKLIRYEPHRGRRASSLRSASIFKRYGNYTKTASVEHFITRIASILNKKLTKRNITRKRHISWLGGIFGRPLVLFIERVVLARTRIGAKRTMAMLRERNSFWENFQKLNRNRKL